MDEPMDARFTRASVRRVHAMVSLLVTTIALSACNLPTDERVTPINADDLPELLTNTTTTTTTTMAPPTSEPPDSGPAPTEPSTTTTTTIGPTLTTFVVVYYTSGSTDRLVPLQRELPPAAVQLTTIVDLLEAPVGIAELGLRSSVRFGLLDAVTIERGVATVSLDPVILDRMSDREQQRAIAQIVLTLTSFQTVDQGNIGFVRFESEGEHYPVFVPSLSGTSQPDDLLAYSDFSSLVPALSATSTTTTAPASPPDGTDPSG